MDAVESSSKARFALPRIMAATVQGGHLVWWKELELLAVAPKPAFRGRNAENVRLVSRHSDSA